jgi:hypothetical protein
MRINALPSRIWDFVPPRAARGSNRRVIFLACFEPAGRARVTKPNRRRLDGGMKPQRQAAASGLPWAGTGPRAVFGLPLRIFATDDRARAAVAEATRIWSGGSLSAEPGLELRIVVDDRLSGAGNIAIDADGSRLILSGQGALGQADATLRMGACAVSDELLDNPELLREQVLEPLVLFLVTRNGRTPIHASGFIVEDLAVLLAGPSGAGKSCLALAADRAGHTVLSDDTVYVEEHPGFRVWGVPGVAHLLPADAAGTPVARQRLRAGRLKDVVPFRSAAQAGPVACTQATFCVLTRGVQPALRRIDTDQAMARLDELDSGFDLIRDRVMAAYARLAAKGAWELTLSREPAASIALLEESLPLLRQTAVP